MVPQILPHLQRRHRSGAPRDLAPSEFLHVSDRRRDHQNSSTHLGPHDQRSRIRRMKWPKSSYVLGAVYREALILRREAEGPSLEGCCRRRWEYWTACFEAQPCRAELLSMRRVMFATGDRARCDHPESMSHVLHIRRKR